jgi:hypothetical protein
MALFISGGTMVPVDDDDSAVTRAAGDVPVRPDAAKDAADVAERRNDHEGVEERHALPLEEAGYGYGV